MTSQQTATLPLVYSSYMMDSPAFSYTKEIILSLYIYLFIVYLTIQLKHFINVGSGYIRKNRQTKRSLINQF